jgi:hypothetical protein
MKCKHLSGTLRYNNNYFIISARAYLQQPFQGATPHHTRCTTSRGTTHHYCRIYELLVFRDRRECRIQETSVPLIREVSVAPPHSSWSNRTSRIAKDKNNCHNIEPSLRGEVSEDPWESPHQDNITKCFVYSVSHSSPMPSETISNKTLPSRSHASRVSWKACI